MWTRDVATPLALGAALVMTAGCGDDTSTPGADGSTSGGQQSMTQSMAVSGPPSSSAGPTSNATTEATSTGALDTTGSDSSDASDSGPIEPGELPEPPTTHGVVYVPHFLSNMLRWYRTDGDAPAYEGEIDLGQLTHDAALDPVGDRLFTAHDVARQVKVFALQPPTAPDTAVDDPSELATIDIPTPPRFVRVDPYHQRLYVIADSERQGTGMAQLHVFDIQDSAAPERLSTTTIPSTTSWDVDGPRRLLVLVSNTTEELAAFDVSTDAPVEVAGSPIDLRTFYPEENQTAFQPRSLRMEPWGNRLYAARSQGAHSEQIVMEYPAEIPGAGQPYDDVASFAVTAIDDPFDLGIDIAERQGILDAYDSLPSPYDDLVFLVANAWNGTMATATVVTLLGPDPYALLAGCGDHEDFGCFLRGYAGQDPTSHLRTDGAACRDTTHDVIAATALGSSEDEPGSVAFFRYEADGTTGPWLPAKGGNVPAAALPIAALCH